MSLYQADDDAGEVAGRGLLASQRFVPGGFFLGWLLENNLAGRHAAPLGPSFVARELTGAEVFARVGGALDRMTIGDHAYPFAESYVHRAADGLFADMAEWFPLPSIFDVRDTWHNYEWMRIKLVERYSMWRTATG